MKPYFEESGLAIYHADFREVVISLEAGSVDLVIADPPYGDTSLAWDIWCRGWPSLILTALSPCGSMWVFGSFRMFFGHAADFEGWSFAQEIVWEKQNGSSFHSDRFKRVHELCAQFYLGEWGQVYKNPVKTLDATARITRRKTRPPHTGNIGAMAYVSEDGGPRLQRSIIRAPNCHGYAEHPTQKPEAVVSQLCEYSGPPHGSLFSPFLGSGTDLVVAKRHGLRAVGCDVDERYCEIAANRLRQGVLDLTPALV